MSARYFARVCAVGGKDDMRRLTRSLLQNLGRDGEGAEAVRRAAEEEAGTGCGFLYEMIARRAYGEADEDTCRLEIRQESCGLWTALFAYESSVAFQVEDWLRLHAQCGRLPMWALRASDDFDREKGPLTLTGGHAYDEWSLMAETWLWLTVGREAGEETLRRLRRLERLLRDEEDELTVPALLDRCAAYVRRLRDALSDGEAMRARLSEAAARRDYQTLFALQSLTAQGALWDIDRAGDFLSRLEALRAAFPE